MFHVPEFYPNISLKLSSVLEEIGVNKRMVLKRRRSVLLEETVNNISMRLCSLNNLHSYYFGSQSEGTTTPGLHSDFDMLICFQRWRVIQGLKEWQPGVNLLMIQEETTPPGYCMLQLLHGNVPTAVTDVCDEHEVKYRGDRGDKVLLKNTYKDDMLFFYGRTKNGPAGTFQQEGYYDTDYIFANQITTLPEFLVVWLRKQTEQGKLSRDMKRYIESYPCYVVKVGRKDSSFQEAEWRISTSHAERCLMFNLNITQVQCYIMFKLLLETHLKHSEEKALSSFMCKNILLLCTEKTHPCKWSPQNLLSVFTFVLLQLKRSILQEHCPHFIMHENNLMAQKFTPQVKSWLLEKIEFICETHGRAFLDIAIDDIGNRLQTRINTLSYCMVVRDIQENHSNSRSISGQLLYNLAGIVSQTHIDLLKSTISAKISFNNIITTLVKLNHHGSDVEQAASRLLTPLICSSLGSVIASRDIHLDHSVSPEALDWLSLGLNSDVASSRLKLASVYFCVGDFIRTKHILRSIDNTYYSNQVVVACSCHQQGEHGMFRRYEKYANTRNECAIQRIITYCVRFLPHEVNCQPKELQYEMFRSTQEDRARRPDKIYQQNDFWMDWAVVDSLPYLYFLQYKTYGHLQRYDEQELALVLLHICIDRKENYRHKETALNLLGQCYQQENRLNEAFHCYIKSLNVRSTNNAAKLHICRLLYAIYRSQADHAKTILPVCSTHFIDGKPTKENPIPVVHMGYAVAAAIPGRRPFIWKSLNFSTEKKPACSTSSSEVELSNNECVDSESDKFTAKKLDVCDAHQHTDECESTCCTMFPDQCKNRPTMVDSTQTIDIVELDHIYGYTKRTRNARNQHSVSEFSAENVPALYRT